VAICIQNCKPSVRVGGVQAVYSRYLAKVIIEINNCPLTIILVHIALIATLFWDRVFVI